MSQKRRIIVGVTAVVMICLVGFLVSTRTGVFIVFDVLGDIGADEVPTSPADAPIALDRTIDSESTLGLPQAIEQPSGIDFLPERNAFAVITDQAELFEVHIETTETVSETLMAGGPLLFRQGSSEAVTGCQDGILVGGEIGRLEVWTISDNAWTRDRVIPLPADFEDAEWSAAAVDPETGEIYLATGDRFQVEVLGSDGEFLRSLTLNPVLEENRSTSEYERSGLDLEDGQLYVVTENYGTLLRVDPQTGAIIESIGLNHGGEISDIAVVGNRAYVTVDHDLFDPRLGIRVYDVAEESS